MQSMFPRTTVHFLRNFLGSLFLERFRVLSVIPYLERCTSLQVSRLPRKISYETSRKYVFLCVSYFAVIYLGKFFIRNNNNNQKATHALCMAWSKASKFLIYLFSFLLTRVIFGMLGSYCSHMSPDMLKYVSILCTTSSMSDLLCLRKCRPEFQGLWSASRH